MTSERIHTIQRHLQHNNDFLMQNTSGTHLTTHFESPTKFQYTLDNANLTYQQRQFYEENGYLIIRKLIEEELLDQFTERFNDLVKGRIPKGNIALMKDVSLSKTDAKAELLYYKAQEFNYDEVFSKFIVHKTLLDYVECFTGPNIVAIHPMLINKPPDSGKLSTRHPVHQDLHAFPIRPANRIVAAWTAMEQVINEENGCLYVIPGSHKNGNLYEHTTPNWEGGVNELYFGINQFENAPKTMIIMNKGDTIFFHPLLLHGSGANYTKGFRKSMSCHYAASDCEYIDVTDPSYVHKEFSKDMCTLMQKSHRLTQDDDYIDFWKQRISLARGKRINL